MMLKLSDNPPILFPEGRPIAEITGRWWVGHTKARFEKAFAQDLVARKIPFFLPMLHQTKTSGGKKRKMLLPLFPGYVFFAGDKDTRYQALLTDRLCQVIEAPDQKLLSEELHSIYQVLTQGSLSLDPYPFAAIGNKVRIAAGPLRGLEGVVIERNDIHARLVLQVSILGQGVAVQIEPGLLEAA